jgi:hypothetical protein
MTPTAKEFLERDESGVYSEVDIAYAMIEFAKLHVNAALKVASENVKWKEQITMQGLQITIRKASILHAYPLENIK